MIRDGFGPPTELVRRVQRRLAADHAAPSPANLARAVRVEADGIVDDAHLVTLIGQLEQELVGCGPLTELLRDPATTDVVVNAPDDVRVDRGNGWRRADVAFADEAAVQRLARRLAAAAGVRLDDAHPYADARLADGTRFHAVLPPLAVGGTCLSLRVLRPGRFDLAALGAAGMFPGACLPTLRAVLEARLALVISGGTGSGKTTLLQALLGAVDPGERIVIVEDAEELRPAHPHVVRLVARAANVEGAGAVTLRDLVRQALRMRPDRLVLGEARGAEVVDLLSALNTGHEGGAGTVHANSAQDVPARLVSLGAMAGVGPEAIRAQVAGAFQVVLHVRREGGRRILADIAVLTTVGDGAVRAVSAVLSGRPTADGGPLLVELLRSRGVTSPW